MSWPTEPLGNLLDDVIDRRGITPLKLGSDYTQAGHRVISAKLIKNGIVDLTADEPRFVNSDTYARWMRTPLLPGDVLLTSEAPLGELAFVQDKLEWCLGQRLFGLRPNADRLDGRYLYYALKSGGARDDLMSRATGTTAQGVRQSELLKVSVPVPPISTQRQIGEVLGAIDDKIAINRRLSETLESIAQALFQSWFVDFDPVRAKASGEAPESICQRLGLTTELLALFPDRLVESELGEIPEGWVWSDIGSQVTVLGGGTPSTKNPEYWEEGRIYWATPKDLSGNTSKVLLGTDRKITEAGLSSITSELLPTDTVLLSSRAPVGYLALTKAPMAINQGFIAMKCDELLTPEFVLHWAMLSMSEIQQRASGTTFQEISKKNFRTIPVLIPNDAVVEAFSLCAKSIYQKITENVAESTCLGEMRDSLLPKLLSGEISPDGDRDD